MTGVYWTFVSLSRCQHQWWPTSGLQILCPWRQPHRRGRFYLFDAGTVFIEHVPSEEEVQCFRRCDEEQGALCARQETSHSCFETNTSNTGGCEGNCAGVCFCVRGCAEVFMCFRLRQDEWAPESNFAMLARIRLCQFLFIRLCQDQCRQSSFVSLRCSVRIWLCPIRTISVRQGHASRSHSITQSRSSKRMSTCWNTDNNCAAQRGWLETSCALAKRGTDARACCEGVVCSWLPGHASGSQLEYARASKRMSTSWNRFNTFGSYQAWPETLCVFAKKGSRAPASCTLCVERKTSLHCYFSQVPRTASQAWRTPKVACLRHRQSQALPGREAAQPCVQDGSQRRSRRPANLELKSFVLWCWMNR